MFHLLPLPRGECSWYTFGASCGTDPSYVTTHLFAANYENPSTFPSCLALVAYAATEGDTPTIRFIEQYCTQGDHNQNIASSELYNPLGAYLCV